MGIRKAVRGDWQDIQRLLGQMDYPVTESFVKAKMERILDSPGELLSVYEHEGKVVGFNSLHFIPQLGQEGDYARISYFAVEDGMRSKGIGREIEQYCADLARERRCDRIEVHCRLRRKDAHRFYLRQGSVESPKYFAKKIDYSNERA